jgi:hypothetical protein
MRQKTATFIVTVADPGRSPAIQNIILLPHRLPRQNLLRPILRPLLRRQKARAALLIPNHPANRRPPVKCPAPPVTGPAEVPVPVHGVAEVAPVEAAVAADLAAEEVVVVAEAGAAEVAEEDNPTERMVIGISYSRIIFSGKHPNFIPTNQYF